MIKQDTKGVYRWSKFSHLIPVEGAVAAYNALNLAVMFVDPNLQPALRTFKAGATIDKVLSSIPARKQEQVETLLLQLVKQRNLVEKDFDEMEEYHQWKEVLTKLPIGVLYLLLTDSCNFRCRYCVIEGGLPVDYQRSLMPTEMVKKGLDMFVDAITQNTVDEASHHFFVREPQVICYGGEPLLNLPALRFVLEYTKKLKDDGKLPVGLGITLNTNASLVTPGVAQLLAEHQVTVAVSIDGKEGHHDAARVYPTGKGTFEDTLRGYRLLQAAGANVSVSCTLGQHNLGDAVEILQWFIDELQVKGFGFNLFIDSDTVKMGDVDNYARKASLALLECFQLTRELGVYEDRMMRKVRAFVEGRIYLNDCAGCGQQIVITPDGQVGTCQAYLGSREYFVDLTADVDPKTHPVWKEWRIRSPLNMSQCVDCIALGICGGGCPHDAHLRSGSIWALDEAFCIHAKMTLEFLIHDLWQQMTEGESA